MEIFVLPRLLITAIDAVTKKESKVIIPKYTINGKPKI
jgi:hypothetical protein